MKRFVPLLLLLFSVSVLRGQSLEKFIDPSIKVNKHNVPVDKKQYYFPTELMPEVKIDRINDADTVYVQQTAMEGTADDFVLTWYSKHLRAMKEPLLFNRKPDKEIYRFTWLRTFHNPVMIRMEKDGNGGCVLFWKKSSGAGGYQPGHITINRSRVITRDEWKSFISLIDKAQFWNMELGRGSIGLDGSEWIMEGATPDSYRVVTVWSPNGGNFYEACLYLLSLTGLIKREAIY